jgi:putative DNA primase/helicase
MGYRASHSNPEHWSHFDVVLARLRQRLDIWSGIGFVFTSEDSFTGLDLDDCIDPDDAVKPWARGLLERFSDTYAEVSPGGAGVKLWCQATIQRALRKQLPDGAIEIYNRSRFFTVTGRRFRGAPLTIADHQADIDTIMECYSTRHEPSVAIAERITVGNRNPTLVRLAGTMHRRGMCIAAIEAALLKVNELQCDPPKPAEEVYKIVRSVERWGR